ncbi:MAG: zf-HC2 domain-containing protein [Candidatus Eisenbacteria bacterium]
MKCLEAVELIAHKLEGSLPETRSLELEEHLSVCSRCRAELVLQKKILEALAEEVPSGLPADFTARVSRKALEAARAERLNRTRLLVPALAVTVLCVVGFLAVLDVSSKLVRFVGPVGGALSRPMGALGEALSRFFSPVAELSTSVSQVLGADSEPVARALLVSAVAMLALAWGCRQMLVFLKD